MLKVLIILPVKIGFDGMTKQVLSYGKYMDHSEIEMDLISCRGYDPLMQDEVESAHFTNVYRMEYRDEKPVRYFLDLFRLIKQNRYDIVHANGQSATMAVEMLAAKIAGCRVRIAHSHGSKCNHIKTHMVLKHLFLNLYTDAIACSKKAGEWLFPDRTYVLLKNGIETNRFRFNPLIREEIRRELKLSSDEIAIGHVGAFEPWKNHHFIINVMKEVAKDKGHQIKVFLYGIDGTTRKSVIEEIEKCNLQNSIKYMGTTSRMPDILAAMDAMVLPSQYEGFPVTVVEWQAAGLPCFVSDTITKDVNINGEVRFLPIENGEAVWEKAITSVQLRNESKTDYVRIVQDAGYDIKENGRELKKFYLDRCKYRNSRKNSVSE